MTFPRASQLGYDWTAQERRCPIAADVKPVRKPDEVSAPASKASPNGKLFLQQAAQALFDEGAAKLKAIDAEYEADRIVLATFEYKTDGSLVMTDHREVSAAEWAGIVPKR